MDISAIQEIISFLKDSKAAVVLEASSQVLKLTREPATVSALLLVEENVCKCLSRVMATSSEITLVTCKALVNLTANNRGQLQLLDDDTFWKQIFEILIENIKFLSTTSDKIVLEGVTVALKLLNNMTIREEGATRMLKGRFQDVAKTTGILGHDLTQIFDFILRDNADTECQTIFLRLIVNLTQLEDGRRWITGYEGFSPENIYLLKRCCRFIVSSASSLRGPAIQILRNCIFTATLHETVITNFNVYFDVSLVDLSLEEESIVHYLLFNLIGNTDTDEEYFPADKYDRDAILSLYPKFLRERLENWETTVIEVKEELRKLIVETIFLLTASQIGREVLRKYEAYEIIKRYHLEEDSDEISEIVFDLVERILGEEEEEIEKQKVAEALSSNNKFVPQEVSKNKVLFSID